MTALAIAFGATPSSAQPDHTLVGFGLDRPLVRAWHLTRAELGIPDTVSLGELFATTDHRAYFKTDCNTSGCLDHPQQWVYGIDLSTGRRLFTPLRLDGAGTNLSCHQTGDTTAACLDDYEPDQIWALNLARGTISYRGKTSLDGRPSGPDRYQFQVAGNHLIAGQDERGLWGIGPRGERTWFAPGNGWPVTTDSTVLTQIPKPDDPTWRVFSVIDGTELTPTPPRGTTLRRATTYPDGFAYEYDSADGIGVLFYDTAGKLLHRQPLPGYNLLDGIGMPIAFDQKIFHVFSATGQQILEIPAGRLGYGIAPQFRNIGDQLWYRASDQWQRWDLSTGKPVPTCPLRGDYASFASDGRVALLKNGTDAVATDLATCKQLWRMPPGGYGQLEQIGPALVTHTSSEIVGLGPPS
ncbi:hypothetical protein ACAG26_08160 [Mycobacterium sp. pUA109]|uniref:hypothetical protein n=1 Tax=Mycobacterium sp. pUA109 TaxID=3238982 RepID=UPI00351B2791